MVVRPFFLQQVVTGKGLTSQKPVLRIGVRNERPHLLQWTPIWLCSPGKLFRGFAFDARKTDNLQGHYPVLLVFFESLAEIHDGDRIERHRRHQDLNQRCQHTVQLSLGGHSFPHS